MELPELKQGLDSLEAQQAATAAMEPAPPAEDYLTMDNLMRDHGTWFDNDNSLGTEILEALRTNGAHTKEDTEATLRSALDQLLDQIDMLNYRLRAARKDLKKQKYKVEELVDDVEDALDDNPDAARADELLSEDQMALDLEPPADMNTC